MHAASTAEDSRSRRTFGRLAWAAVGFTYALIVLGGIVRITGSGMACGEDWPLCRGRWLPTLDAPTLLEYGHRLAAAGVSVLVLALAVYALLHRREASFPGRGGLLRPAALAAGLLVAQVLLGAVTVQLRLPSGVVATHLTLAMATFAALIVAALRATLVSPAADGPSADRVAKGAAGAAFGAAVLGYLVVLFGGIVANTGAGPLCQGFPLCGGRLVPEGGALVHIHWTHRLLAYLLAIHVAGAALAAWRKPVGPAVRRAALVAAALVAAQITVAAALVWSGLPKALQALHLAVGTAVWAALVVWAVVARRAARVGAVALRASGTG